MPPVLRKLKTGNSLPVEEEDPQQGTTINQLPFDCFYLIFRRIDLRTQILNLRTVCHLWYDRINQICAQKSHLTLTPHFKPLRPDLYNITEDYFSPRDLEQYVKNRTESSDLEFRLPKMGKLTTNSLINRSSLFSLFATTLTELTLNFNHSWHSIRISVGNVEKLMKSFHAFTSLRALTLKFEYGALSNGLHNNNQLIRSIYEVIGDCVTHESLPTVTQLHLNIDLMKREPEFQNLALEIDLDPHILSHLEHFSMDFHTKRVPALMGQLNPGLTFLSFNCDLLPPYFETWNKDQLDAALLGEPQFGPSLTHLRLSQVWHLPLRLFCDRFSALQSVQLGTNNNCEDYFDEKLIKPLNQLEQLVELRLHGYRVHVFPDNSLLGPESRCLPRVKKLTWYNPSLLTDFSRKYCDKRFDGSLFGRTVAGQFANLEELVILTRDYGKGLEQPVHIGLHHFKNLQTKFFDFYNESISVCSDEEEEEELSVQESTALNVSYLDGTHG